MSYTGKSLSDILIVGGGIIGLAIARELKKRGVERVTILEKNSTCGMEASSAAAGMLSPQAEAESTDDFFNFCRESRDLYPNFARELLEETGVDIELDRNGTLYLAFNEKDAEELEKKYSRQKALNLAIEKLDVKEILEIEPDISPGVLFGLRFPMDWQVENRKIIEAFNKQLTGIAMNKFMVRSAADKIKPRTGGEFVCREVSDLIFDNNRVVGVKTDIEDFFAPVVVIASGAWTGLIRDKFNLLSGIGVKPVRGQMLAFGDNYRLFKHTIYTRRGYVVPKKNSRILVGATVEDVGFENRTTGAGTASLLETAFEISPRFKDLSLKKNWSGLRPVAADRLPVLGTFPEIENLLVATAHYRNGILLAPKTAEIIADKVAGNTASKYLKVFSPCRFRAAKGRI
jgi:glycine oxidase